MIIINETLVLITTIILFIFNYVWYEIFFKRILAEINHSNTDNHKRHNLTIKIILNIIKAISIFVIVLFTAVIAFKMDAAIFAILATIFLWLGFVAPFQLFIILSENISIKNILIKVLIILPASLITILSSIFILAIFK